MILLVRDPRPDEYPANALSLLRRPIPGTGYRIDQG
jgi:hypothetical protein